MLASMLLILVLTTNVFAADEVGMKSSVVHLLQNFPDLQSTLEALPKECTKNGKTYKEGEEFTIGNLRYKCQKYGVYTIEGCITDNKENLKVGEVVVKDNIKSQCLGVRSSVFYRETVCGILGEPECDKIGPPKSYEEALKKEAENTGNTTGIPMPGLPPGWKVVDQTQQAIPGSNKRVISRTLMFSPTAGSTSRVRRQSGKSPNAAVEVGPPKILRVSLGDGKIINVTRGSTSKTKQNIPIYTQTVTRTLNILSNKNIEEIAGMGTARKDLSSKTPAISNVKGSEPATNGGPRVDVN